MLLHYCFWSHITFPLASLGVLERKLKELQQTVILHLLPGCYTPASRSPKGCMGRLGSQSQRSPGRKSIQSQPKVLHTLVSSILPQQTSSRQQWSSSVAVCHSLGGTKQFRRNPVFKILFQGESRSVFCAVWSCDVCPQKYPVWLMTHGVGDCTKTVLVRKEIMEWLKVLGRKLFAPFLTLPASFSSSVGSRIWILSKPSVTENCCQFFLAPNSYCGLGASTRKITTLISSTAAAPWRSLCLLWPGRLLRVIQRQHRSPCTGLKHRQSEGSLQAALPPSPPPVLHVGGNLRNHTLHVVPSSGNKSISEPNLWIRWPTQPQGFIMQKANYNFNSVILAMGWIIDFELHCCLSSVSQKYYINSNSGNKNVKVCSRADLLVY